MKKPLIIAMAMSFLLLGHIVKAQVGSNWTEVTSAAPWSPRAGAGAVVFNGQMWVLGGHTLTNNGFSPSNDVWSSTDGTNWTEVTAAAPWSPRIGLGSVVFNNQMWVLGGTSGGNEVWSTSDGTNWTRVTAAGPWSGRSGFGAVVFNNQMWVLGGHSNSGYTNDVWSSSDGTNWTQVTAAASWSGRYNFGSVVFNGQMWVLGGYSNSGYTNDVWYSPDGTNWSEATPAAPWSARYGLGSVVFNGQMWVLGGTSGGNDVWSSSDGANWTEVTAAAPWSPRYNFGSVVFNGGMWVLGGNYLNDVWVSAPPPVASFTAAPTNGFAPLSVTFTDTSTGTVTSWFWNFGDGGTTNLATNSVVYTYKTGGVYTVTEIVTGWGGVSTNVQANNIVVVNCPTITLSPNGAYPTVLPDGTVGASYSQTITASGGMGSYTFAITSGTLPTGLALSSAGALSGTPTMSGTYAFTVTATDTNGCTGSQPYSLTMTCPAVPPPLPPAISMNPSNLSQTVLQGQDAPSQSFAVWNSAQNCSTLNYTISTNAFWLSVSPTTGTSAGATNTHTVSYATAGLPLGLYNAAITITSADATNSPQNIPVSLNVVSFLVSNANDSGLGSLRQAILDANAGGGGTIGFANVSGTITPTSGELVISTNVTILGPGPATLAISGSNSNRVFNISSNATVTISGVTICNGHASDGAAGGPGLIGGNGSAGGGIYNSGTLTVNTCIITNNSSGNGGWGGYGNGHGGSGGGGGDGGGIYNGGAVTLTTCTLSGNSTGGGGRGGYGDSNGGSGGGGGDGGGISNGGALTLNSCTLSQNSSGTGGAGGWDSWDMQGQGGQGGSGGAICNAGGLSLTSCSISGNTAGGGGMGGFDGEGGGGGGGGGGIYNASTLTLIACTIYSNSAGNGGFATGRFGGGGGGGGGIYNASTLTLIACAIYSNSAGSGAGGVSSWCGSGDGGNGGSGGGISGGGTLINCTVYGNRAGSGASGFSSCSSAGGNGGSGGRGGGISGGGTLINSTIASNSAAQGGSADAPYGGTPGQPGSPGSGGGVEGPAQLLNTLVAYNTAAGSGPDVSGSFASQGFNLIGNTNGSSGFGVPGDLLNVNPLLGPLADNGGPTFTCAVLPGSPAINAGTNVGAPQYDQRGVFRPQLGVVDIGAFEYVFCVGDADCDDIPDWWERQYFGHVTGQTNDRSCATCDADGTGQNNLFKYLAGLDPTNSASVLRITSIVRQSNDVLVTWTSVGGYSYVLQSTKAAAIDSFNTNFADASPVVAVPGAGESTTNYLDVGAAYAPVLTSPGGTMVTTSVVPSTVYSTAAYTRGITDSTGRALPIGCLLMLGTFSISESTIQSNFSAGNVSAIMSNFTPYSTSFHVGDGTGFLGSWDVSLSAAGFGGQQIYLLAIDKPTFAAATHLGIYTAPSWVFPADGDEIAIDLADVTDFVIGAQGGSLTIGLPLGGATYTFNDTARLSVLPGRILFYRVRLAQ